MNEEKYVLDDSDQDLDNWKEYGYDSKEEYEEFLQKCEEDSLYGYGDMLTMKELRALLKKEPYKPQREDEHFPDHLILDEKTGMYYTDFFAFRRTHMILGNILAEECMMCENLNWERVTDNYSPYVIARIEYVCTHFLAWQEISPELVKRMVIKGKIALPVSDNKYPYELFTDFSFDWLADRVVWLADFVIKHWDRKKSIDSNFGSAHTEDGSSESIWQHDDKIHFKWNYIAHDYKVSGYDVNDYDPYAAHGEVEYWDKSTCLDCFDIIHDKRGLEVVTKVLNAFRQDWRRITTFNEYNLGKISDEKKEEFRHFLFEEMDYYIDEWTKDEKALNQSEINEAPKSSSEAKQEETFENVFSYHFFHSEDFNRLHSFLCDARDKVSDVEWANYAFTLYKCPKIFIFAPKTFKSWLPRFCTLFGRDVTYRDPNKLQRTSPQKDISCYLPQN